MALAARLRDGVDVDGEEHRNEVGKDGVNVEPNEFLDIGGGGGWWVQRGVGHTLEDFPRVGGRDRAEKLKVVGIVAGLEAYPHS